MVPTLRALWVITCRGMIYTYNAQNAPTLYICMHVCMQYINPFLVIVVPKVQAVVYVTRSVVDAENEKIVQRAIEAYNSDENRKYPFRVTPPMFNFDAKMADLRKTDKYYRHPPSEQANGCFMAIVSKEVRLILWQTHSLLKFEILPSIQTLWNHKHESQLDFCGSIKAWALNLMLSCNYVKSNRPHSVLMLPYKMKSI